MMIRLDTWITFCVRVIFFFLLSGFSLFYFVGTENYTVSPTAVALIFYILHIVSFVINLNEKGLKREKNEFYYDFFFPGPILNLFSGLPLIIYRPKNVF